MPLDPILGSLEQLVLLALLRLEPDAYGRTIHREMEERTGRSVSIGSVYVVLERLETKGYVSSSSGPPTPARGGRSKRLFVVTGSGRSALDQSRAAIAALAPPGWLEGLARRSTPSQ